MPTVDWKRGVLAALAPPAVALGYLLWRHGGALPTSTRFWLLLVLVIGPDIALVLAGDYLQRTGRVAVGKLLAFAGLAWLLGGCALLAAKTSAVTFTDAERAPFVTVEEDGRRWLRHPTLGFSVLHPGPGFSAERSEAFRQDAHFYSFVDPNERERLTIGLFKGQGGSAASLRTLLETMSRQTDTLGGGNGLPARVVDLDAAPTEPPRGALHVVLGDGRHFRAAAYAWRSADGTPFAILVAIMARAPDAGADVLASFRP
jgi:hypothetical protein